MHTIKKQLLFIINPISGGRSKRNVETLIERRLDCQAFDYTVQYSQSVGHARQLSLYAALKGFYAIIAVGGDGTVNEVAQGILETGSKTALGIIPFGSGNGLARHLGIPMDAGAALEHFNRHSAKEIDTVRFNNQTFFNMAGIGFDAHVAGLFAKMENRGLMGYLGAVRQAFFSYPSETYQLEIDGKDLERKAFMICFANSSQFGNDAKIAPKALIDDGLLDVVVVKRFPMYMLPVLAFRLMTGSADRSAYVETIKAKEVIIKRSSESEVHLDGEPASVQGDIRICLEPKSLRVVY